MATGQPGLGITIETWSGGFMNTRINHVAVIVAAVVYFVLGAGWFTFFSQAWLAGIGKTMEQMQHSGVPPAVPYALAFVCNLIMAYALAFLAGITAHTKASSGAKLGALLGIAFVATAFATEYAFEARSVQIFAINAGYPVVGMIIMGAIVGGWRGKAAPSTMPHAAGA
jgi:hypothetical protein